MLCQHGFFDCYLNPNATPGDHVFKIHYFQNTPVVYDSTTRRFWYLSGVKRVSSCEQAHRYVEELNRVAYAGFSDWRLPTLEEAMSLMHQGPNDNDPVLRYLFGRAPTWIWTCDTVAGQKLRVWVVYYAFGFCYYDHIDSDIYGVRAVRS